jgi:hypothetical protein
MLRLLLGLILLFSIGSMVGPLVSRATSRYDLSAPEGMPQDLWSNIVSRGTGGSYLGYLERPLYFAAFWNDTPVLVAGWLAFKVASGWHNWNHIVRLPEKIDGVNDKDFLRARSQLGSWIFHRFLIGTLGNVLAGLVAAVIAKGL